MKCRIPDPFFVYAQKFTLESMVIQISKLAFDIYCNSHINSFVDIRTLPKTNNKIKIPQTWLIDVLYDIVIMDNYGFNSITDGETLQLLRYYFTYQNTQDRNNRFLSQNVVRMLYGFSGEQFRFQKNSFHYDYARESYILEKLSYKYNFGKNKIDFLEDFRLETCSTPKSISVAVLIFLSIAIIKGGVVSKKDLLVADANLPIKDLLFIIDTYSIDFSSVRSSLLKRQVFYPYPIISMHNIYVVSNPFCY